MKVLEVKVPDIGGITDVDVIEINVAVGEDVTEEQALITLEGDKATMEIPSPATGRISEIKVKVGDKVSEETLILNLEQTNSEGAINDKETSKVFETSVQISEAAMVKKAVSELNESPKSFEPFLKPPIEMSSTQPHSVSEDNDDSEMPNEVLLSTLENPVYAGPSVRRFARQIGVDLTKVAGQGRKGRVLKSDVESHVKQALKGETRQEFSTAPLSSVDFGKFGSIETASLSKIKKLSGANLHRNWVRIPHVTQFDEADITELESFRQSHKKMAEQAGCRLTPLVFIMKAVVSALKDYPTINASLDAIAENLILKNYYHIGVAVDTSNGLVVPVIRDVDQKSLFDLAKELGVVSQRAREKRLSVAEMQGGCFTISSLGGVSGTAFTPIINAPEVAILGVSKSEIKPVYMDGTWQPRLKLPLSFSYDHRVIDGAEAARFTKALSGYLSDIRTILL